MAVDKPLYALNFPRLFALGKEDLLGAMLCHTDDNRDKALYHTVEINAARVVMGNVIGFLCMNSKRAPSLTDIPANIDYAACRRLEVRKIHQQLNVCLCDDARPHAILYQTPITQSTWKQNKSMLLHAEKKMREALALKPQ